MTELKIYSRNILINKNNIISIDLDELKESFPLDFKFDVDKVIESKLPAFTSLSYNKIDTSLDSKPILSYNRPRIGPLPYGTYCTFCDQEDYHTEDCSLPEEKSLNVTLQGFNFYIMDYTGPYEKYKKQKLPDELLLDDNQTLISYLDMVKKRGRSKEGYSTKTTKFSNSIVINYTTDNIKTSIRIDKNGVINIINLPSNYEEFLDELVLRINKSKGLTEEYKINNFYEHSLNSQFTLFGDTKKYQINFDKLQNFIVNSEYSDISFKYSISPTKGIKLTIQIYKYGTVQISMSYCKEYSSICTKIIDDSKKNGFFSLDILEKVRTNLLKLFENTDLYFESGVLSDEKIDFNSVSGKKTIYKLGSKTEVCRKTDATGSHHPIPYSFKGKCPQKNQYIEPEGILATDNLYYPCCYANKINKEQYKKYLINGFKPSSYTKDTDLSIDNNSGLLVPYSTNINNISEVLIDGEYIKVKVLKKLPKNKYSVERLDNSNIITIDRDQFKRDSRYFRGLIDLSKVELINCIIKNINKDSEFTVKNENLIDIKKYLDLPIKVPYLTYLDLREVLNINYYVTSVPEDSKNYYLFLKEKNSYLVDNFGNIIFFEYISDKEIIFNGFLYFNNENNTYNYYITDVLYYNNEEFDNLDLLKRLSYELILQNDNISVIFSTYYDNPTINVKKLLLEAYNSYIIFTPKTSKRDSLDNYRLFSDSIKIKDLVLQVGKTELMFENKKLPFNIKHGNIIDFKNFKDFNNLKSEDYVLFNLEYDNTLDIRPTKFLLPISKVEKNINYENTILKLYFIMNPIKKDIFINNQDIEGKFRINILN